MSVADVQIGFSLSAPLLGRGHISASATQSQTLAASGFVRSLSAAAVTVSLTLAGTAFPRGVLAASTDLSYAVGGSAKARAFLVGTVTFQQVLAGYLLDSMNWEGDELPWDAVSGIDLGRYPIGLKSQSFIQFGPAHAKFGDAGIQSYVERLSLPPDDRTGVFLITEVAPLFFGGAGTTIQVSLGTQERTQNDSVIWEEAYSFVLGTDDSADLISSGRFLALRFEAVGQPHWQLSRFDVTVQRTGED
ncbi:MAG: hypothetical protein DA330_00945 [Nitrososphaera sp.]|nr:hypothetical protein [Nitrososphaera sp.]